MCKSLQTSKGSLSNRYVSVMSGRGSKGAKSWPLRKTQPCLSRTTPPAVSSRSEVWRIREDKNEHVKELKDCKKEIDVSQTELQNVQNKIDKASGPFKCKFDKTMNDLKLKRVVYHSGALIGPDVHKVLQPASTEAFGSKFQPIEIDTSRGKQLFGSEKKYLSLWGFTYWTI